MERPENKRAFNGTIMVRVAPSVHEWLAAEAHRRRQSMNQIVSGLIQQEIKRQMEELNDESSEVY